MSALELRCSFMQGISVRHDIERSNTTSPKGVAFELRRMSLEQHEGPGVLLTRHSWRYLGPTNHLLVVSAGQSVVID